MPRRSFYLYFLLPYLALIALGLFIYRDYGAGLDEAIETFMIYQNLGLLERYSRGDFTPPVQDPISNIYYYGTFFNLLAYPFQRLANQGDLLFDANALAAKHAVEFLFTSLAYVALAAALWQLTRSPFSGVAALLTLGLQPYFFANNFFSPKDPPFTAMYTCFSVYGGAVAGYWMMHARQYGPFQALQHARYRLMLTGLLLGLTGSIRIGGLIGGLHLTLTFLLLAISSHIRFRLPVVKMLTVCLIIVAVIAFLVVWALHPIAYPNPIRWMTEAASYLLHHPYYPAKTLFMGEWVYGMHTPWYYLPVWFFVQTPVLWFPLALLGLIALIRNWQRFSPVQQAIAFMLLLQGFTLPFIAIAAHSTLYSGIRQFHFVYPVFAFLIGYGLLSTWQTGRKWRYPLIALTSAYALFVAVEMIRLHPFQHEYINEAMRADADARWNINVNLTAGKAAADWLNGHIPPFSLVLLNFPKWIARPYLYADLEAVNVPPVGEIGPYYVVAAAGRPDGFDFLSPCPVIHRIERPLTWETLTIAIIRRCG